MHNISKIIILIIVFISCEPNNKKEKPTFSLKKDYAEFNKKLTKLDTLNVWINLSLCTFQGVEKLTITRKNDSLKIQSEFSESNLVGAKFKKTKPITISMKDSIWKFGEFLKRNKHRLHSDSLQYGRLQMKYKDEKLHFFTLGLGDSGIFLSDYSNTMKNLIPKSKYHIFSNNEIIEQSQVSSKLILLEK